MGTAVYRFSLVCTLAGVVISLVNIGWALWEIHAVLMMPVCKGA